METDEAQPSNFEVDDDQIHAIARQWVFLALQQNDPERYRQLLADLKNANFDDPMSMLSLAIRLRALSECVSCIKEYHDVLLDHILYMSFWNCNAEVSDALTDLVVNLASSSGLMVPKCLDMLVRNFLPPSCGLKAYLDCYTETSLARKRMTIDDLKAQYPGHLSKKNEVLDRVHTAIQRIVELVPIASTRLERVVLHRMPHKSADKEWNALYLESMLMLDAKRIIISRMLDATVDRLIEIDVEIEWEAILGEEPIFSMDTEEPEVPDPDVPDGPGSEAQLEHAPVRLGRRHLGITADKMDAMMNLALDHIRACAQTDRTEEIYKTLLASFRSTVLTTHKSKFTQFVMFYLCSLSPTTCAVNFAVYLWDIFQSVSLPKTTRMSAAAYLASYLSRARFLPLDTVVSILNKLVSWCASYAPSKFNGFQFVDVSLYGVFYSACQAAMYVMCFRLRDLHDDATQRPALKHLRLKRLIEHKLSPLLVCLPSVVEEFLKQCTAAQLITLSETQGHMSNAETSKIYGGANRLDMFFPFDPYLLKDSNRFIKPAFTDWSMVRPLYEAEEGAEFGDAEDGESEDEEEEEEPIVYDNEVDMVDQNDEQEEDQNEADFRNSLECMSITPPARMLPPMLMA